MYSSIMFPGVLCREKVAGLFAKKKDRTAMKVLRSFSKEGLLFNVQE